jgi:hypothetical protein
MIGNQVALKKDQQKPYGIATSVIIFAGTGASRYIMSEEELEYGWGLTMKEVQFAIVLVAWFSLRGVWLCLSGAVFREAGAWMDQSCLDSSVLLDDWVPMAFWFCLGGAVFVETECGVVIIFLSLFSRNWQSDVSSEMLWRSCGVGCGAGSAGLTCVPLFLR